jgi:hypothetical protein
MPILNYTTEVKAEKTISEIYQILLKAKAKEISFENDAEGDTTAVKFMIFFFEKPLWFRIEPNYRGVLEAMKRNKTPPRYCNLRQAFNVAWRITKDAIEAQMAIVQSNQGEIAQVFLPFAIDAEGRTVFQVFAESRQKLLSQ